METQGRGLSMSYSRWGSSFWYTYWCSTGAKYQEDEILEICSVMSFTFEELKNIKKCVNQIELFYNVKGVGTEDKGTKPTKEEIKELKGYMLDFVEDVKARYKERKLIDILENSLKILEKFNL